jgi:hypothetical protein
MPGPYETRVVLIWEDGVLVKQSCWAGFAFDQFRAVLSASDIMLATQAKCINEVAARLNNTYT